MKNLTLVEYTPDHKPTGRFARIPGVARAAVPAMAMMFGCLVPITPTGNGWFNGSVFAYQGKLSLSAPDYTEVSLSDLFGG